MFRLFYNSVGKSVGGQPKLGASEEFSVPTYEFRKLDSRDFHEIAE